MMKNKNAALLLWFSSLFFFQAIGQDRSLTIPLGGNTWPVPSAGGRISNKGIIDWADTGTSFHTWVRTSRTGKLHVWLEGAVPEGKSTISIRIGDRSKDLVLSGGSMQRYDAGQWTITDTGYQAIRITGSGKSGTYFAAIENIVLEGDAVQGAAAYVPDDHDNFFYWGRRGPSVHLNYHLPEEVQAEWFYNEVTVPKGQDIEGSYFMANGFEQGYFGMQVNSPTERHILFSVWSPFHTDDPHAIPDSQKIVLLKKGEGVHAGEFGDEGSGGQSYLNYPWKAGNTYRFLLHAQPLDDHYTAFTAWFYAPELGQWKLIASFKRPQTHSWLTHLHSFLENFDPQWGDRQRYVLFDHQWVRDPQGKWLPLNKARFTGDNTARKGYRMDYAGGIKGNAFYLQNCGFFNTYTPLNTEWERPSTSNDAPPDLDLEKLP